MVPARVTWLGQNDGAVLQTVVEPLPRSDGWSRSEKILLAGVLVNMTYLIYAILRRGTVRKGTE